MRYCDFHFLVESTRRFIQDHMTPNMTFDEMCLLRDRVVSYARGGYWALTGKLPVNGDAFAIAVSNMMVN